MRLRVYLTALVLAMGLAISAEPLSLDSCRSLAIAYNKQMRIKNEQVKAAGYQKKQASAAYLPLLDFTGGYTYNQKELSIFDSDQLLPTKTFNPSTGSYDFNIVTNPETGTPVKDPNGQYIPQTVALIPKEAMTYDIHNVFFGAITLTQPIYMGGKIKAMNKIAGYAEEIASQLRDNQAQDVIYAVDAAYWQVVSLKAKQKLATSYLALLDTLHYNVTQMLDDGVATRSDLPRGYVKRNQSQIDLVKVNNGLSLSRMALSQLCGLPIDNTISVKDEGLESTLMSEPSTAMLNFDIQDVYNRRHDLRALQLASKVAEQQKQVEKAAMLPNVALVGAYAFSNPNMFNGFSKSFDGAFSVGAMVTIPLWHWGGNYNKYQAAKTQEVISNLTLEDAKEKVELQANQAAFRADESLKTFRMTQANLAKADENLRTATVAFKEGVATADNVMEAQTAWLKANSEKIDAEIDVHLCDTYLSKVLGLLNY